jgi:hypothetical protein
MDPDARLNQMEDFFAAYAAGFNRALADVPEIDVEATAGAFADCFIAADPNGVSCGKNDEQFRAQIPEGFAFYRSIGTKSMRVASLAVTPLDDYHLMAKVRRVSVYRKKGGGKSRSILTTSISCRQSAECPGSLGISPGTSRNCCASGD